MSKRVTKLLFAFALVLQTLSPTMDVASASEENEETNVVVDDTTNHQSEDSRVSILEVDEDKEDEIEGEVLNGDVETPEPEIEIEVVEEDDIETLAVDVDDVIETRSDDIEVLSNGIETRSDDTETRSNGVEALSNGIETLSDVIEAVGYEGVEIRTSETGATIRQSSIDAMRTFLDNNTPDNPLLIPTGLNFTAVMNEFDWGEGVSVWAPMSGLGTGQVCGTIVLHLNQSVEEEDATNDEYGFLDVCIYYEFEVAKNNGSEYDESENDESEDSEDNETENDEYSRPANRSALPQTGVRLVNASLIGIGVLAVCGGLIYLRNRNKK